MTLHNVILKASFFCSQMRETGTANGGRESKYIHVYIFSFPYIYTCIIDEQISGLAKNID